MPLIFMSSQSCYQWLPALLIVKAHALKMTYFWFFTVSLLPLWFYLLLSCSPLTHYLYAWNVFLSNINMAHFLLPLSLYSNATFLARLSPTTLFKIPFLSHTLSSFPWFKKYFFPLHLSSIILFQKLVLLSTSHN